MGSEEPVKSSSDEGEKLHRAVIAASSDATLSDFAIVPGVALSGDPAVDSTG